MAAAHCSAHGRAGPDGGGASGGGAAGGCGGCRADVLSRGFSALGALVIVLASFAFRVPAFTYVFTGGGGRFWFALDPARAFVRNPAHWPIAVGTLVSLLLWLGTRRSRYFGNTVPLIMAALLLPIVTEQTITAAWLWAIPFLLVFIGGCFADAFETRQRRLFLALGGALLLTEAITALAALPAIAAL